MPAMIAHERIDDWLERYRRAWRSDDRHEIAALFTEDVVYYTAPYREPLRGLQAVFEYWVGEQESTIAWTFESEVVAQEQDRFVVRAVVQYPRGTSEVHEPHEFHDLWLVTLHPDGRASEFVEYFMRAD